MTTDPWVFEKALNAEGYQSVAGVDEAGRGPLAGPVVSAAVMLACDFDDRGVTDSKTLTWRQRETFYERIYQQAKGIGIGIVDAVEIDRINILQATRLSMAMAVANLKPPPDYVLIDGKTDIDVPMAQQSIVKGDSRSISIAAASIVAKVSRDRLMKRYHADFPEFGFDRHKGYPTRAHRDAIAAHGPCWIHRRSFNGVRQHLRPNGAFLASSAQT